MPGARQSQAVSVGLDERAQDRGEVAVRAPLHELGELGQHACGSAILRHIGKRGVAEHRHRGCRLQSVTSDVADYQHGAPLVHRHDVVPVAADLDP